ncbi:MAG: hypothetical protein WC362_00210 [Methanoregula sp.]
MVCRSPVFCLVLILVLFATSAGCTSAPAPQPATTPVTVTAAPAETTNAGHTATTAAQTIAEQLATVKSDNVVWTAAYKMFSTMKSTEYVHPPYTVDEANGTYKFDCLGFADHALMDADMAAYTAIGKGANPSIDSYSAYFSKLSTTTPDTQGWTRVAHPIDLQPGDICLWLKPSTLDTGHMWIIAGSPLVNPKRTDEVLVRIFDSTGTVHSDDSRTGAADKTGLGSGILGMMVGSDGNPAGLYWEGGASTGAGEKDTTIICGRLNK